MTRPDQRARERAVVDDDPDVAHANRAYETFGRSERPRGMLRRFVDRYGWRAYALPVLVVVTVVALLTAGQSKHAAPAARGGSPTQASTPTQTGPPTAAGSQQLKSDTAGPNAINTTLPSDALPTGGPYTAQGNGTFTVIPGSTRVIGTGTVHRYTIEVEGGVTGIDLAAFAKQVDTVLGDARSWTGHGSGVALQRVSSGPVDFKVTMTSSMTVRKLCGYSIPIETSCWDPDDSRVVINNARWVRGDPAYIGDLDAYRVYMINHEDGHALGHLHAHQCLAGGLAPVMMQQTIGLKSTTGKLCEANPWPYPLGAKDAPGAEAPDTAQNDQFGMQNS